MEERREMTREEKRRLIIETPSLYVCLRNSDDRGIEGTVYQIIERAEDSFLVDRLGELVDARVGFDCCGETSKRVPQGQYSFIPCGYGVDETETFFAGNLKYYNPTTGLEREIIDLPHLEHRHASEGHSVFMIGRGVNLIFKEPMYKSREEIRV